MINRNKPEFRVRGQVPRSRTFGYSLGRLLQTCALVLLGSSTTVDHSLRAQEPNAQSPAGQSGDSASHGETELTEAAIAILRERCFDCHSHESGEAEGGLMLDSLSAMVSGGASGPALVSGKPGASRLIKAVEYGDAALQMPPDSKLPEDEINRLRQWIEAGAPVPDAMRGATRGAEPASSPAELAANHWAYQPLALKVEHSEESESTEPFLDPQWTPIDDAVASRLPLSIDDCLQPNLQRLQLEFSPRADRATLVRRLKYDLSGLPPTYEEIQGFLDDPRSDEDAYRSLVDRFLGSQEFGERWARYWMDVARYASNKGYVFREDREYAESYRYRDWLIEAFNSDLPFDEFVRLQLGADLYAADGETKDIPALGFLTLGRRFLNNQLDIIDDRMDVVTRGLMGMTLACARCHDHKYDPLSQADYYSMAGIFFNVQEPGGDPWPHRLADAEKLRDAFILKRGNIRTPGQKVPRRFVRFLSPESQSFDNGSGRRELAECIVDDKNPLTPRVWANRVWMRLMGTSIVDTPSDLGLRCPEPMQRQLLDRLAVDLVQSGWSTKSLIREIVLSRAYTQSSLARPDGEAKDLANQSYWRMNRRRLDFEAMRDSLLQQTAGLDPKMFGQSERIDTRPFSSRRTVYAYIDRQNLPSVFRTFDMASPDTHSPRRPQTSVPQQGLYLLNSDFLADRARKMGNQLKKVADAEGKEIAIQHLFRSLLSRDPSDLEAKAVERFIQESRSIPQSTPEPLWQCGYAAFDPESGSIAEFQPLPKYVNGSWQGGDKLPDDKLGWCLLHENGGHAGNDLQHAVVRRFKIPQKGRVEVVGRVKHPAEQGDGIRASILLENELRWQESCKASDAESTVELDVSQGQTLDFVVDCLGTISHDSFQWVVKIRYIGEGAEFDSQQEFPTPRKPALGVWAQAAQALLASNEFVFVD